LDQALLLRFITNTNLPLKPSSSDVGQGGSPSAIEHEAYFEVSGIESDKRRCGLLDAWSEAIPLDFHSSSAERCLQTELWA